MADFPNTNLVNPNSIFMATTGTQCLAGPISLFSNSPAAVGTWSTANTALYVPIQVEVPFTVSKMAVRIGTQSGNCDIGIYDEEGNAIVTKGSTAVGAAGLQTFDMTASINHGAASPVLNPGTYYLALNADNTTVTFFRTSGQNAGVLRVCGVQQQAVGAVALPTTATFANPASGYMPCIGVSGNATV